MMHVYDIKTPIYIYMFSKCIHVNVSDMKNLANPEQKLLTPSTFKFHKPEDLIIPHSKQTHHQSKVITFPQLSRNTQKKTHKKNTFITWAVFKSFVTFQCTRLVNRAPKTWFGKKQLYTKMCLETWG